MFGLAIVVVFLVVAAIGPWIVPFPEDATGAVHLDIKLQPPDAHISSALTKLGMTYLRE